MPVGECRGPAVDTVVHTGPMISWAARFLLLRVLPRKLVPIITIVELARLAWGFRRRRFAVNEPRYSRTAPPPPLPDVQPPTAPADLPR
jgi:hypothetical protein